jgi:hypothetical protein
VLIAGSVAKDVIAVGPVPGRCQMARLHLFHFRLLLYWRDCGLLSGGSSAQGCDARIGGSCSKPVPLNINTLQEYLRVNAIERGVRKIAATNLIVSGIKRRAL